MSKIYHCYYDACAKQPHELPAILYLKKKEQFCFYDSENDMFLGPDLKPIDITGALIIPHNHVRNAEQFRLRIKESGGIISGEIENENIVTNWFELYSPKRKFHKIKGRELLDLTTLEELEREFGPEIFFKTIEKSYYEVIKLEYLKDPKTVISRALEKHLEEEFIISEVVDIKKDDLGRKEYRIFVFNNQILNISRCTDCFLHQIEPEVYERAKQILEEVKALSFPSSYVMDLFEYVDKNKNSQLDILEFNGISASGRYLYNSVDHQPTDDMLHIVPTNIAIEKRPLVSLCLVPDSKYKSFIESIKSSKYCDEKGTFAYDLKQLHEYNNRIDFSTNFDLGRRIEDSIPKPPKTKKPELNDNSSFKDNSIFKEMHNIIQNARVAADEYEKVQFLESLSFDECPTDEMYLTRYKISEPDDKELPKVIKIKPEVLRRLKEEHKI